MKPVVGSLRREDVVEDAIDGEEERARDKSLWLAGAVAAAPRARLALKAVTGQPTLQRFTLHRLFRMADSSFPLSFLGPSAAWRWLDPGCGG